MDKTMRPTLLLKAKTKVRFWVVLSVVYGLGLTFLGHDHVFITSLVLNSLGWLAVCDYNANFDGNVASCDVCN